MPVDELNNLFDVEIEETEIEVAAEDVSSALPTRTITTCAIC